MPCHVGSSESQALDPVPKKQRTEQTEKSFADTSETQSFRPLRLPCSIRFSELFKEPGNFHTSTQIQSTDTPVKLAAKEQDKNIESQGEKSQSVVPEDQQKQDVPPQTYSTDDYVLPASTSELESDSLETTQDYLQLWPKTSGPNNKSKYEVKSWPYISQDPEDSSEPRVTHYYSCHPVEVGQQELTPGEEKQETSNPQASQDTAEDPSEKIISYLSSDQSEAHE
ncbi:uncharacterized protein LOC118653694 [Myotis myotis]|uniref:uncharacterized protein LOC118653694 n=1 Tax=Myotis myotis TaxID=51298 RepID=UPI00174A088F|nr:uncharacterized protein LOC118653694 [Myotis myotis]